MSIIQSTSLLINNFGSTNIISSGSAIISPEVGSNGLISNFRRYNVKVNGTTGSSFLSGTTTPLPTLGQDGDSYVNTITGETYVKVSGVWIPDGGNLSGPMGATGEQGPIGPGGSGSISNLGLF